jgi:hypothetical protein
VTGPIAAQRARTARLQAQADRIAAGLVATQQGDTAPIPVVLMPANTRGLVPLPAAARDGFRAHLAMVITEAFVRPLRDNTVPMSTQEAGERDDAGETLSRDPGLPAHMVLGSCATCRGSCCTSGGTRAFLTADAVHRVRAQQVTLGEDAPAPAAITALYVEALPAEHYDGSCVFHARLGCALPRQLRSNLCNRYQCGELTQLSRALQATGATRAFVGAATGSRLERMAAIGIDGVRDIPVPAW